jgi:hypothetical protein
MQDIQKEKKRKKWHIMSASWMLTEQYGTARILLVMSSSINGYICSK